MPTAKEVIEAQQREITTSRLIARRFPDAEQFGGDWESGDVTTDNAKGVEVDFATGSLPGKLNISLRVYAVVQPKGCDEVRVYGKQSYKLTAEHVKAVLSDNPRVVLKGLSKVLAMQESKRS